VEGQALRDRADRFEEAGAVVLGASFDTVDENKAFDDAQQFAFPLLADTDRSVGTSYEVTRDADERYAEFPQRISYLIDPDGVIRRSYVVSDVATHADDVLDDLDALQRA
jgi:peroxiredoxin Q/BCP